MKRRRRRGVLLLSLALASGGLAASEVSSRTRAVEERVGPLVPVVAAREAIEPGTKLTPDKLAVVQVPARYAPPDALADPAQADGLRTGGALERGSYLTASAFAAGPDDGSAEHPGNGLGRGERAIELKVAGAEGLGDLAGPGARVDVLVTTESGDSAGRTELALEDIELLALRAGGSEADAPAGADAATGGGATATLRVTLKQAVYLTSAQNFAREVRLLPRAAGDRRRAGRLVAPLGGE
jgi:pilus assembly protein CpaB